MHIRLFVVTHQTARLSIGGANTIFEFYGLLDVLEVMTDFYRQIRTCGIKSLMIELPEAEYWRSKCYA